MAESFKYVELKLLPNTQLQNHLTAWKVDAGSAYSRKAPPDPLSPTIRLKRNYYDGRTWIFNKEQVTFEPGRTILVGANGTGKSTMLKAIAEQLRAERVACLKYDDRRSGGMRLGEAFSMAGNIDGLAAVVMGSEGERINMGISSFGGQIRKLFELNRNRPCWILIDSTDSGLSVDNIVELKEFLDFVGQDAKSTYNITLYVVVAANSYEMAAGERCLEPKTGKYRTFKSYAGYRRFVLASRRRKDRRDGVKNG